ncbi:hypothetical protein Pmani_018994 [Petrolisthes manimaculis]|uniref:Nbr1 FW domain-containing protein n=1 Tax=Petrolisthes manimaculis TaxID=1843537 RepID=A0AAE1U3Y2_9EUCA|nr:hypothetical protein Pmani_018994 [Petrolisthes manimaculis]
MKYGIHGEFDDPPDECFGTDEANKRLIMNGNNAARGGVGVGWNSNTSSKMEAVVFSIQFYGKTVGEVGLLDQDLSELDWKKFKSYIFQNLLSVNNQENICVSYNDDEGDKLPIDSEEEYREALKVAKKKAEAHDKLVLDITRQGGLPTVLSMVSSGIKRVSSSPPKEGGMSFFKASSPPKESLGFAGRGHVTERKLLPTFLSSERNDGVSEGRRGWGRTRAKEVPLVERQHLDQPPPWFTNYMAKFREEVSQETAKKVTEMLKGSDMTPPPLPSEPRPIVTPPFHPVPTPLEPDPIDDLQIKFSRCSLLSQGACNTSKVTPSTRQASSGTSNNNVESLECGNRGKKKGRAEVVSIPLKKLGCASACDIKGRKKGKGEHNTTVTVQVKKGSDKGDTNDTGAKSKKPMTEDERLSRKLEERLVRLGEKFSRLQEKWEEKQIKKHDKLVEKLHKQQERLERKKPASKFPEEMDRTSRTQEKVLAKMEGLRKKQSCSPEELNKLRKMVDKQHRVITAEQRQQRRNERKAGNWKAGKAKKVSIDDKAFPVDASLLHAALQELEALAEDSPSETSHLATQGYDARYIKDITFPDGSEVAPGAEFIKTWRVANSGIWTWNEKTTLCKWTQVRFRDAPAGWKLKPALKKIVCPPLEPGQESDISITFTAPSEPGWYATHWRFCQRGRLFGNQMWCAVHVVDNPDSNAVLAGSLEVPERDKRSEEEPGLHTPQEKVPQGDDNTSDNTSGVATMVEEVQEVEAREEVPASPSEEPTDQTDCEFGIVEDYYDAEDPVPHQLSQRVECSSPTKPDEETVAMDQDKQSLDLMDLISFEEEAELVTSGSSTPVMIATPPGAKSVIPLKDIARESVESLREALNVKAGRSVPRRCCVDEMSDSSGSLSELDSEDQAILNESDTENSDYEYYVVHIPDCFDLPESYTSEQKHDVALPTTNKEETERPESPDFLTADEDDRTTTIVTSTGSPHTQQQEVPSASVCGEGDSTLTESSCATNNNHPQTLKIVPQSGLPVPRKVKYQIADSQETTLAAEGKNSSESTQPPQDHTRATWKSGTQSLTGVVCEQPLSAQTQHKQGGSINSSRGEGAEAMAAGGESKTESGNEGEVAEGGQDAALPDELVSIIPEDLVRGVWNTARTFITRINQEMLSPSGNSPGRLDGEENEPTREDRSPPAEELNRQEESTQSIAAAPECDREMPLLPPPLQQLADMGFTNHEVNQRLLTKYNNDVACAVAELIVLNFQ